MGSSTTPRYEVFAINGKGDEKLVGTLSYKQDAIKVADRFLNAEVVRIGSRTEKVVYSHTNVTKADKSHLFEKASV